MYIRLVFKKFIILINKVDTSTIHSQSDSHYDLYAAICLGPIK